MFTRRLLTVLAATLPLRSMPSLSAKAKTGIGVKVVAQGIGQALDTGRRSDADVVFVHANRLVRPCPS
jgi:ABC-type tungstate transport system permease subunit